MRPCFARTTAAVTLAVLAACSSPQADPKPPAMDEATMMAEMMKLATPGPEHAELAKMAGPWESHYRMRWTPDAPWEEFDGTSEAMPILGGRYMQEKVSFDMMGMPMEGLNILGYDNLSGEYTSMWADTMSTWFSLSRGRKDAQGAIDYRGEMTDVAGTRPFRMVVKPVGQGAHIEMYDTIPPQGEVLVMTIDTRRPAGWKPAR